MMRMKLCRLQLGTILSLYANFTLGFRALSCVPLRRIPPSKSLVGRKSHEPGLQTNVENYEQKSKLHNTIVELSRHIPTLLSRPLTEAMAANTYTEDTRLVVLDRQENQTIELVSSRVELLGLTNVFVAAAQASLQATKLLASIGLPEGTSPSSDELYNVTWKMAVNREFDQILVSWSTQILLTSRSSLPFDSSSLSEVSGLSRMKLENGTVSEHCLLNVKWNDKDQDASSIAQSLSVLRKTVMGLQQTSLGRSIGSNALLSQIRRGWMAQMETEDTAISKTIRDTPLPAVYQFNNSVAEQTSPEAWSEPNSTFLIPGTQSWSEFERAREASLRFMREVVPVLSTTKRPETLRPYFCPNATFLTLDNSVVVEGRSRMASLYSALATLRDRTLGSWALLSAELVSWDSSSITLRVNYKTATSLPGAASTAVSGCDRYLLKLGEVTPIPTSITVEEVYQEQVIFGNNQNSQDAILAMKAIGGIVESGRFTEEAGENIALDIVQRWGQRDLELSDETQHLSQRSDEVAATIYRLMETLHRDLALITSNSKIAGARPSPPALSYAAPDIQLMGYLGEVLVRGKSLYITNLGLPLASFRGAVESGRIDITKSPDIRIELKSNGDVRSDVTIHLKLLPLTGLSGGNLLPRLDFIKDNGMPISINLVSDYSLDFATGKIQGHQLVESRVNGQLTPADVVAKWAQRQRSSEETNDGQSWLQTISDALEWIETLNRTS